MDHVRNRAKASVNGAALCRGAWGGLTLMPLLASFAPVYRERHTIMNDPSFSLNPTRSFQGLLLTLQQFWAAQGCVVLQPYDMEVGAGTFHPATTLRSLGPKPWKAAYVQPSRRPKDGRYGENPNRLQHYYQFQVLLKPSPPNLQDLYLDSLKAIGMTSALSRMTGKARRWAPGGWAGSAGATVWRSASSPISSRWRALNVRPSPVS